MRGDELTEATNTSHESKPKSVPLEVLFVHWVHEGLMRTCVHVQAWSDWGRINSSGPKYVGSEETSVGVKLDTFEVTELKRTERWQKKTGDMQRDAIACLASK